MNKRPKIYTYTVQYNIGKNVLGYNLRFYRKQQDLSQYQLSIRTNLQRSYIAEIESGKRNPTISKIYLIAIGLRLEPWRLFKPITLNERLYGIENNFTSLDITLKTAKILTANQYMEQLIKNIQMMRKRKEWTQKDLSMFSSLSEVSIRNIEQRRKEPTLESISKLAITFHIPVWQLIKGIDNYSIWFENHMWL